MIQLLDCTLREGSQIIDINKQTSIKILQGLSNSRIDYIEVGLLDKIHDIKELSEDNLSLAIESNSIPVVFANFNRYDFSKLPTYTKGLPQGIRVGFKFNDFIDKQQELKDILLHIKSLNYRLFIQPCHTLSYSDASFKHLLKFANMIEPQAFSIVDSYGSMFEDDLMRYVKLTNKYLDKHIKLNFHSHNNLQLSLALALSCLNMTKHNVILDASLYGIGRGGGNLNTELIAAYLNRNFDKIYDFETIVKTIEKYILPLKGNVQWGYSLAALDKGLKDLHP